MQSTPPNIISEEEAIDFIMKNYHDNGDYKFNNNPHYGPETYFMAIYDHNDIENNDDDTQLFTRTNGVVGVVSAQLRKRAPLIAGPSILLIMKTKLILTCYQLCYYQHHMYMLQTCR